MFLAKEKHAFQWYVFLNNHHWLSAENLKKEAENVCYLCGYNFCFLMSNISQLKTGNIKFHIESTF